jgi:hypothetical protein
MTGNVFLILIIVTFLLLSKRFAIFAVRTALRIISILSAIIVIVKNKEILYELMNKVAFQFIPYIKQQVIYIFDTIINYAIYYAEKAFSYLVK